MPLRLYSLAFVASLLTGCVAVSKIDYPTDWAAQEKLEGRACPPIAGKYKDVGTLRGYGAYSVAPRNPNGWKGGVRLLTTLVGTADADGAPAIELIQPDADTLIVQVPGDTTNRQWTLKRNDGDFHCSASGLTMSKTGNLLSGATKYPASDAFMTAVGLLVLSGGIVSHTRSFRPLADGSLLMEVSQNGFVAHGVVLGWDTRSFVRWEQYRPEQREQ